MINVVRTRLEQPVGLVQPGTSDQSSKPWSSGQSGPLYPLELRDSWIRQKPVNYPVKWDLSNQTMIEPVLIIILIVNLSKIFCK